MAFTQITKKEEELEHKQKLEFIDAHCHLDMLGDEELGIAKERGVTAVIVNGLDTKSNIALLEPRNMNGFFVALGIHPESVANMGDEEIEYNLNLIRSNRNSLKSIGEIGLDYSIIQKEDKNSIEKQKQVFETQLKLAIEIGMPVSVHSRDALDDVLDMLESTRIKKAHIHFFEGDAKQAKRVVDLGFMVSVPPMHSSKRMSALAEVPIQNIMAETDSPTAGMHIYDIDKSIMLIAKAKGMDFESCAIAVADNTKRFFNIGLHNLIRRI